MKKMTTVRSHLCRMPCPARVAGKLPGIIVVLCSLLAEPVGGQGPPMHWQHAGTMPPGAIGGQRLGRGGPLSGYYQPVEIRGPAGAVLAWAQGGQFAPDQRLPATLGMLIAPVYRLRISNIPQHAGSEVFPTVEVIDRLYPPPGEALRFPIQVVISQEDLELALDGNFVTRVIYVEDPGTPLPHAQPTGQTNWFDAAAGDDPLVVADRLGRPVAILRIGARLPDQSAGDPRFMAGSPPVMVYPKPRPEDGGPRAPAKPQEIPPTVAPASGR